MGLWLLPEDIEERRSENNYLIRRYSFTSWDEESSVIHQVKKEWTVERQQRESGVVAGTQSKGTDHLAFLKEARESLLFRRNLVLTAKGIVKSTILDMAVSGLDYQMRLALDEIQDTIAYHPNQQAVPVKNISDEEKAEEKKLLIRQIFAQLRKAVGNAKKLPQDTIRLLREDTAALKAWYEDENANAGSLKYDNADHDAEIIAEFFKKYFNSETVTCSSCGARTTSYFGRCTECAKQISGE